MEEVKMLGDRGAIKSFVFCSSSGQVVGCQFGSETPIKCSECLFSPIYEEGIWSKKEKAGRRLKTKLGSLISWLGRWQM
jgi:hypothetical protein